MIEPRCYECLTTDVAVKLTGPAGLEIWLCAADWEATQTFQAKIASMLAGAAVALEGALPG